MNNSKSTGRTRRFTMPEVYRAIARTMGRPGHRLVAPAYVRMIDVVSAQAPAAELQLPEGQLAALIGWARAMNAIDSIVILPLIRPARTVSIRLTGTLPGPGSLDGPTVAVVVHLDDDDLPAEIAGHRVRVVTTADLYALGDAALSTEIDTLVGAR